MKRNVTKGIESILIGGKWRCIYSGILGHGPLLIVSILMAHALVDGDLHLSLAQFGALFMFGLIAGALGGWLEWHFANRVRGRVEGHSI